MGLDHSIFKRDKSNLDSNKHTILTLRKEPSIHVWFQSIFLIREIDQIVKRCCKGLDLKEEDVLVPNEIDEKRIMDYIENKDITIPNFNCFELIINKEEIEILIDDIKNKNLNYEASGFFWGSNIEDENNEEWHINMLNGFQDILDSWDDTYEYFYTSWY